MAYNGAIYAGSLLDINVAAAGSLAVLNPLLAQVDFAVFGSLGIGTLQANLQSQLSAALQAQAGISLGISNPFAGFASALAGISVLQAQITQALAGAIPVVSFEATAQLSAIASFSAVLGAQIGGLEALIQGALAVKAPARSFAGQLSGALSAGPVFVVSFDGVSLSSAGSSIASDFSTGLSYGMNNIGPSDTAYGLVIVTKSVSAWGALQATLRAA